MQVWCQKAVSWQCHGVGGIGEEQWWGRERGIGMSSNGDNMRSLEAEVWIRSVRIKRRVGKGQFILDNDELNESRNN